MKSVRLPFTKKRVELTKDLELQLIDNARRYKEWRSKDKRSRDQDRKKQADQRKVNFPTPLSEPIYKPGDPVMLWQDSRNPRSRREYGRVICNVWNSFLGTWDVYTAFFGNKWPSNDHLKMEKPYVLRYLEGSLKPYQPKRTTIK